MLDAAIIAEDKTLLATRGQRYTHVGVCGPAGSRNIRSETNSQSWALAAFVPSDTNRVVYRRSSLSGWVVDWVEERAA